MSNKVAKRFFKKNVTQILLISFLTISTLVGTYLLKQEQDVRSKARDEISTVCSAGDLESLRGCFDKVNNNQVDNVEITSLITCSGERACSFTLHNVSRPVLIYGTTSDSGFRRTDSYNYPILTINGSNGVYVNNLKFEESRSETCEDWRDCSSPIVLGTSQNITLDKITVENSNRMGMEVSGLNGFTIRNSTIKNVAVFGIWLNDNEPYVSSNVRVENNLFQDNESNGLYFSGRSNVSTPSVVRGNTFIHNHRNAVFHVCGPSGTGPCSGGQILIERGTDNLVIEDNEIKDGVIDPYPREGAAGIEFGTSNIQNVIIRNNDIHDNTGHGIGANDGAQNVGSVTINGNRLFNNRWGDVKPPPDTTSTDNCFSSSCPLSIVKGTISAVPNPCELSNSDSTCLSVINWSSQNGTNVRVLAGDSLFASADSGPQNASWITKDGAVMNLYSGETLLSSTYVRGVLRTVESPLPSVEPSPSPSPSPSPEPSPSPSPVLSPSPIPSPSPSPSPSQNPSPLPSPSPSVEPAPSPVPSPSPQILLGDINGDGELSIDDYNILVRHFGPRMPTGGSPADLNHDNEVSIDDYNLFVRYFSVR